MGVAALPVALFLLAVVLSVVYRFVPDTDRSFWSATPGALFAVIRGRSHRWGSRSTWPTSRIAA